MAFPDNQSYSNKVVLNTDSASFDIIVHPYADIASRAMQGLLAAPTDSIIQSKEPQFIAKMAVECTEALLSELSKSELLTSITLKTNK